MVAQEKQWQWVLGYWMGEPAKNVIGLGNAGMGYFVMEQSTQGNRATVQAAFRRVIDGPVPEHLTVIVDPFMIRKLNNRYAERHDTDRQPVRPSNKTVQAVAALFNRPKTPPAPAPQDYTESERVQNEDV